MSRGAEIGWQVAQIFGQLHAVDQSNALRQRKFCGSDFARRNHECHFFDVGGNSIRLIETHKALEESLDRTIPMVTLFQYTTVHSLANWLAGNHEKETHSAVLNKPNRQKLLQQRRQLSRKQ